MNHGGCAADGQREPSIGRPSGKPDIARNGFLCTASGDSQRRVLSQQFIHRHNHLGGDPGDSRLPIGVRVRHSRWQRDRRGGLASAHDSEYIGRDSGLTIGLRTSHGKNLQIKREIILAADIDGLIGEISRKERYRFKFTRKKKEVT